MITGVHDLTVHVSDLARAAAFYGDRLGLRRLSEGPDVRVFDLGGLRLHVRGGAKARPADARTGVVITLRVRDIFSVVDHLREESVRILGEIEHGDGGNAAFIADPDGNVFRLLQAP